MSNSKEDKSKYFLVLRNIKKGNIQDIENNMDENARDKYSTIFILNKQNTEIKIMNQSYFTIQTVVIGQRCLNYTNIYKLPSKTEEQITCFNKIYETVGVTEEIFTEQQLVTSFMRTKKEGKSKSFHSPLLFFTFQAIDKPDFVIFSNIATDCSYPYAKLKIDDKKKFYYEFFFPNINNLDQESADRLEYIRDILYGFFYFNKKRIYVQKPQFLVKEKDMNEEDSFLTVALSPFIRFPGLIDCWKSEHATLKCCYLPKEKPKNDIKEYIENGIKKYINIGSLKKFEVIVGLDDNNQNKGKSQSKKGQKKTPKKSDASSSNTQEGEDDQNKDKKGSKNTPKKSDASSSNSQEGEDDKNKGKKGSKKTLKKSSAKSTNKDENSGPKSANKDENSEKNYTFNYFATNLVFDSKIRQMKSLMDCQLPCFDMCYRRSKIGEDIIILLRCLLTASEDKENTGLTNFDAKEVVSVVDSGNRNSVMDVINPISDCYYYDSLPGSVFCSYKADKSVFFLLFRTADPNNIFTNAAAIAAGLTTSTIVVFPVAFPPYKFIQTFEYAFRNIKLLTSGKENKDIKTEKIYLQFPKGTDERQAMAFSQMFLGMMKRMELKGGKLINLFYYIGYADIFYVKKEEQKDQQQDQQKDQQKDQQQDQQKDQKKDQQKDQPKEIVKLPVQVWPVLKSSTSQQTNVVNANVNANANANVSVNINDIVDAVTAFSVLNDYRNYMNLNMFLFKPEEIKNNANSNEKNVYTFKTVQLPQENNSNNDNDNSKK